MSDSAIDATAKSGKTFIAPKDAVAWFLRDMAQVSGYLNLSGGEKLSAYATFRPMLTAPDPWYFAGIVALESCKICDLFPSELSKEVMREVFARMDSVVGRDDDDASTLAFMIMGRLGMGALLMHRKVPDNLLAKVMLILIGSSSAAAPFMPAKTAHEQIRAALKLGPPVWWAMFQRRHELRNPPAVTSRLMPSLYANETPDAANDAAAA